MTASMHGGVMTETCGETRHVASGPGVMAEGRASKPENNVSLQELPRVPLESPPPNR